ncbi:MAG TPA: hypothetical protein VGF75_06910, partial [Candidatus Saccharimonadales bacterium]
MQPKTNFKLSWLRIGYLLLAAVAMYALVSQVSSLKGSWSQLKLSNRNDDLLVIVWIAVSYLMAALTYYFIALKPLKYLRTVVVESAIN